MASETAKNLIIPIPEDILNKENISPQLAYPISSDDKKKEIDINTKIQEAQKKGEALKSSKKSESTPVLTPLDDDLDINTTDISEKNTLLANRTSENKKNAPKEGFIDTLSSIFNKTAKTVSDTTDKLMEKSKNNSLTGKRAKSKNVILPAEMRLSFQPNRAEISGQTLRWIQAFALKTAQTSGMMLELRIDGTSSTKLQQKRLNLLYNILTNKGVDYSMINTVFTSRDPNSFILRIVAPKKNNKQGVNNQKSDRYIQW